MALALHLGNARRRGAVLSLSAIVANRWALGAVLLVVALQVLAVQFEPLGNVLHTIPLGFRDWSIVVGLAAVPGVVGQIVKRFGRA